MRWPLVRRGRYDDLEAAWRLLSARYRDSERAKFWPIHGFSDTTNGDMAAPQAVAPKEEGDGGASGREGEAA